MNDLVCVQNICNRQYVHRGLGGLKSIPPAERNRPHEVQGNIQICANWLGMYCFMYK